MPELEQAREEAMAAAHLLELAEADLAQLDAQRAAKADEVARWRVTLSACRARADELEEHDDEEGRRQ